MLEVLVPTPISNVDLLPGCLESIEKHTGIPYRVTILIDGGLREDFTNVESFLAECDFDWRLLHNQPPIYLNRSIIELADGADFEFSAIVRPEVRVLDPEWVAKWRKVFSLDHRAVMVDALPGSQGSCLPPTRRARTSTPPVDCKLAVFRTKFLALNPPADGSDPVIYLHEMAHLHGGNSWHHPGIRIAVVEHKEHRLWPAPSERTIDE